MPLDLRYKMKNVDFDINFLFPTSTVISMKECFKILHGWQVLEFGKTLLDVLFQRLNGFPNTFLKLFQKIDSFNHDEKTGW